MPSIAAHMVVAKLLEEKLGFKSCIIPESNKKDLKDNSSVGE